MDSPALALSGGGVIAMLSSLCTLHAIHQHFPQLSNQSLFIGATSGGIIGSMLHATSRESLGFPPSWHPRDYGSDAHLSLKQRYKVTGRRSSSWMGAIVDVLQPLAAELDGAAFGNASMLGANAVTTSSKSSDWWYDVLAQTVCCACASWSPTVHTPAEILHPQTIVSIKYY